MSERHGAAVRTPSALSVEISELLRHPGASRGLRLRSEVGGLTLPLARIVPGSALDLDLRLDALVDGIHASGTVRAQVALQCRRCLAEVRSTAEVPLEVVYLPQGRGDDETYRIDGERIDLEPAVRDAILLSIPLNPICREDCAGLCPTCGADRNITDCGHRAQEGDERWSALEELRRLLEG